MDIWDEWCAHEAEINNLLDNHNLILFFRRGDDVFGAPEESRLVFAKMKDDKDEDEISPNWKDDASFIALNLLQSILGDNPVQSMFGPKDIKQIKIIDRDEAARIMSDQKKKGKKKDKK